MFYDYQQYFGDYCQYVSDGFSAGLPIPIIAFIWAVIPATILTFIGLYKWSLLNFRYNEIKSMLKWIILADSLISIYTFYMLISGLHDLARFLFADLEFDTADFQFKWEAWRLWLLSTWFILQILLFLSISYIGNGFRIPTLCRIRNQFCKYLMNSILFLSVTGIALDIVSKYSIQADGSTAFLNYITAGIILLIVFLSGSVLRTAFGDRSSMHFPDTIFPVFIVDSDTNKMIRDDSSTKNLLVILFVIMYYMCFLKVFNDTHDSIIKEMIYFIAISSLFIYILDKHFYTKKMFTKSWKIVRNQPVLLDRLRSQTIEHEMKDLGVSGSDSCNFLCGSVSVCKIMAEFDTINPIEPMMESSYKELSKLIATQSNHPWLIAPDVPMFDTHSNCIEAVGLVPAAMPPSWSCFVAAATKINIAGDIVDNLNDTEIDRRERGVIQLQTFASSIIDSDSDSDSDSDGDGDDDDYPELLVSSAGHSAVEGIYTFIGKKENTDDSTDGFPIYQLVNGELGMGCYITVVAIDDGWDIQRKGGTLYWVIMHGNTVVYRAIYRDSVRNSPERNRANTHDSNYSTNKYDSNRSSCNSISGGETKNTGSLTDVIVDGGGGPLRPDENSSWMTVIEDSEPSPSVVSTVLNDWIKVYRAGKGILKFQESMFRLAKEEQRLVARFRLLIMKSAFSQMKVEENVLWNFVTLTIPVLEEQVEAESIKAYYAAHEDSDSDDETLLEIENERKQEEEKRKSLTEHVSNPLCTNETKVMGSSSSSNCTKNEGHIAITIIDRYDTSRLVERSFKLKLHKCRAILSIMEEILKKWKIKINKQSLILVYKNGQMKLDVNKCIKHYSNEFNIKGSKIILIEKYNLSEMSSYEFKSWLLKKEKTEREPPRKKMLLRLGKIYSDKIKLDRLRQAKDADLLAFD